MRDPLLLLKSFLSEKVTVFTRDSETPFLIGNLLAFDEHFNLILYEKEIIMIKGEMIVYVGQE
ncbi:hypothetical protein M153_1850004304 [Pseudoloma neurophilia]|uniref:Sm domain-containing protein n=1 Tax=Pseudoloma neurophilia TaxID=146866 RepID=A0A0R0M5F0_9MICR|nr:hypothetical protein M153_1850004304 [Pseudoloma neurophilia]